MTCVSRKDNKSLRKRDVAKIIKLQKRARQCQSRKNIQKKCVSNEGKNNSVQKISISLTMGKHMLKM